MNLKKVKWDVLPWEAQRKGGELYESEDDD